MNTYSKVQLERLGNTIVYLANAISSLNKTQLLKLLFLIEYTTVILYKRPFLDLKFEVWRLGPVAKDIYIDLSSDGTLLKDYINVHCDCKNITTIKAKVAFCDDEFSDNDIEILDDIIRNFGEKTARKLVNITHNKAGIWYKLASENNLLDDFNNGRNSSDVQIDLSAELEGCDKDFYFEQCQVQSLVNALNS